MTPYPELKTAGLEFPSTGGASEKFSARKCDLGFAVARASAEEYLVFTEPFFFDILFDFGRDGARSAR